MGLVAKVLTYKSNAEQRKTTNVNDKGAIRVAHGKNAKSPPIGDEKIYNLWGSGGYPERRCVDEGRNSRDSTKSTD